MVPAGPLGVRGGEVIALLLFMVGLVLFIERTGNNLHEGWFTWLVHIGAVVLAWEIVRKILGTVMDNHWRKQ